MYQTGLEKKNGQARPRNGGNVQLVRYDAERRIAEHLGMVRFFSKKRV
jgi:hypothetical protein